MSNCYTLILDLKILTQIPLLFSNAFKFTMFSTVLQLHTLLLQSFKFLHKIIQKGILVISYRGTHFQSLQCVPESSQFVLHKSLIKFCTKITLALHLSQSESVWVAFAQGHFSLFTLFEFWAERYFEIPHFW